MSRSPALLIASCVALGGGAKGLARPPGDSIPITISKTAVPFTPDELAQILTFSPLPPVPRDPTNRVADDPAAAHLGQFLFFDKRLSGKGEVSCSSCHDPGRNWTDGQPVPTRFSPELRHVPSLWNVAYNRWFFWDGRADSLWTQALSPLEEPREHGGTRLQYARVVYTDPLLKRAYEHVFGAMPELSDAGRFPIAFSRGTSNPRDASAAAYSRMAEPDRDAVSRVFSNLGKALAAYERRLVSRHAPFDVFVEGLRADDFTRLQVLSSAAQRGLKLFIGRASCRSCHHGPNFTDGEFHDTGLAALESRQPADRGRTEGIQRLVNNPFNTIGDYSDDPAGRTQRPTAFLSNGVDRFQQFKTPSLRNVALTAPYMHRGQLATLEDVLRFYSTLLIPGQGPSPQSNASPPASQPQLGTPHTHGEHLLFPLNLSRDESADLIAFLSSLTDTHIDSALTTQPASPVYP